MNGTKDADDFGENIPMFQSALCADKVLQFASRGALRLSRKFTAITSNSVRYKKRHECAARRLQTKCQHRSFIGEKAQDDFFTLVMVDTMSQKKFGLDKIRDP